MVESGNMFSHPPNPLPAFLMTIRWAARLDFHAEEYPPQRGRSAYLPRARHATPAPKKFDQRACSAMGLIPFRVFDDDSMSCAKL